MGKYYEDHPDQLSEKIKDQYEFEDGDELFGILLVGVIVVCVMLAFMGF